MKLLAVATSLAAIVALSGASPSNDEANWVGWRGPDGLGISNATSYPDEWGPGKNIAWRTPVPGRGHSSPIVWGDRLFLTTSIEGGKAQ